MRKITANERAKWLGWLEEFIPSMTMGSRVTSALKAFRRTIGACDALEADNVRLREALKHYTDAVIPHDDFECEDDGEIARKALKVKP